MDRETRASILIVDDRPENILALESVLVDLGQNLISATSAREALRVLLSQDVALVLLDVEMPGLSGFELAELIRERERTQNTPIIFVSANNVEDKSIFKGYALGAVDYLPKPIKPEVLKSKVRFFTELYLQNQEIKRQSALLEVTNARLDQLNNELEERVRARTRELEIANRELEKEIETRKRSETRLAAEHAVTTILSNADDLAVAMPKVLRVICEVVDGEAGFAWLLDSQSQSLRCEFWDSGTENSAPALFSLSTRAELHQGDEAPGIAWKKRQPVNLRLASGVPSERTAAAASSGLVNSTAFPIVVGKEFYGAIEFFSRTLPENTTQITNMLEAIGRKLGLFIRRKRAEGDREALLAREKLLREQAENASKLKDEFLATVSHELRTPMNSILGWGKLLNTHGLTEANRNNALEAIYRNAKSQAQLIDDLLDTSRLISGKLLLNLAPANIVNVVEAAAAVVRPTAESKGVELSIDHCSEDYTIICDPHRLQQMVWNLLTNAVKFTSVGGRVNVSCERKDNKLRIVVSDTGKGIDPEFLPFVFDRFRQADSSSTKPHDGLGLGLAIVKQLADLHGGAVSVESEGLGKGATFTLSFPYSPIPNSVHDTSASQRRHERAENEAALDRVDGIKVLIVDDDDDAREMLAFALGLQGAQVETSNCVGDAIDAIVQRQPDVLLTDINMPGEDGYSLIRKLRNGANAASKIPAIALTAMARAEDSDRAIEAGFQMHLPKPVELNDLIIAIGAVTGNGTSAR